MGIIQKIIVLSLTGSAALWDIRTGKIPNKLILAGYALCILFQVRSLSDIPASIGAALWPIALLYPLFILRAIGAGDIKLFSVLSVFFSVKTMCLLFVISLIAGTAMSLTGLCFNPGIFIQREDAKEKKEHSKDDCGHRMHIRFGYYAYEIPLHRIHYAPCIAVASVVIILMEVFR